MCIRDSSTPFWRQQGASGAVLSHAGPVSSWWEAGDEQSAALVGLGVGPDVAGYAQLDAAELKAVVLQALSPVFGAVVEQSLVAVAHHSWQGDAETYNPAGKHRDYGHALLREPLGVVHLAGTESERQNGHLEGAVAAGERAATEVAQALGKLP
eukprot:TRINITY_DN19644_c0_g1_i1.p3 TRINITY_DN19644_c0_g1~~TRINITY_DN19644_c0_g1_i1.p3  ORF type:complete len:154 (-),score=51.45 TRINITY_DN19644_c0_g1_i1:245-706(-)